MIAALFTLLVTGIVGLVLFSVLLAVIGTVFGLAFGLLGLLLFKVVPVLLIGWVVLKLVGRARRPARGITDSDQKWLDS